MSGAAHLVNIMRREAIRADRMRDPPPQYGLISAYDPDLYAVKVRLMPEDIETQWMPMLTLHIGDEYGVLFGPEIDDQVLVGFRDGDKDDPFIVCRVHSDEQKPPKVEPGEMLLMHKSKGYVKIDKNNTITTKHKKGHLIVMEHDENADVAKITTSLQVSPTSVHKMVFEAAPDKSLVTLEHAAGHRVAMDPTQVALVNADGSNFRLEGGGVASIKAAKILLDGQIVMGGRDKDKMVHRKGDYDSGGFAAVEGDPNVWTGKPGGSGPPLPGEPDPPLTS